MKAIALVILAGIAFYFLPTGGRWCLTGFSVCFTLVSLGEYWVHRVMHWGWLQKQVHLAHHAEGTSGGWWKEFLDYAKPAVPLVLLTAVPLWWLSPLLALGWAMGGVLHIAYSAFVHELSHTDPYLLFWLQRPIHYIHHKHNQWYNNFAFSTTLWDKVFGTYKDEPWPKKPFPFHSVKKIRWF